MEFLKKHYEKLLLGVVLLGLVVGAAFLPLVISSERSSLEDRKRIIIHAPKALDRINLSRQEELIKRAESPVSLDLVESNRVFNPMDWKRKEDGNLVKLPSKGSASLCVVTNISPLYFIINLERVEMSESGTRYVINLTQQVTRPARKGGPFSLIKGEKKVYPFPSDKKEKDWFMIIKAEGPAENPTLTLQLSDWPTPATIATNAPFKRVEGYTADLYYPPERKNFPYAHRKGDPLTIQGEEYNIVDIKPDVVVLSAKSNGKKISIPFSPGP